MHRLSNEGGLELQLEKGRKAYLLTITGNVTAGAEKLESGDGARLAGDTTLVGQCAMVLMIETKLDT